MHSTKGQRWQTASELHIIGISEKWDNNNWLGVAVMWWVSVSRRVATIRSQYISQSAVVSRILGQHIPLKHAKSRMPWSTSYPNMHCTDQTVARLAYLFLRWLSLKNIERLSHSLIIHHYVLHVWAYAQYVQSLPELLIQGLVARRRMNFLPNPCI